MTLMSINDFKKSVKYLKLNAIVFSVLFAIPFTERYKNL